MSSSLRRGAFAAVAIAFSIASLAACGAGNNAETLEVKPDNAATSVGAIKIQNATVITQPDQQSKGPAVISATIFNNGNTDQTLDSISVQGDGTAQLSPAGGKGKVTVPAHGFLVLGGKGNASAALPNPGVAVQNGNAQQITFTFSTTGAVTLRAYVVPAVSYFDKWGPSSIPAAPGGSGSPVPSGSASGKPSSGKPSKPSKPSHSASGSPSASESAGTTATPGDSASQSAAGH
ncbi:DUF461 domain-containing protein [Streptomyces sp. NPDC046197]|uniref:DUF461 domain-containing protein n=1 Tax=Streptomyces sp. NPDC046197 TaxID=3154337 RepID=UPI0033D5444E